MRELPDCFQPFDEGLTESASRSTDYASFEVVDSVPPPAIPPLTQPPATPHSNRSNGKHNFVCSVSEGSELSSSEAHEDHKGVMPKPP